MPLIATSRLTAALLLTTVAACQPTTRPPAVVSAASKPATGSGATAAATSSTEAPADGDTEDLFAGAADALAVDDSDGSSSLRSKHHFEKMEPDMVVVELVARVAGKTFPSCHFLAKILREATGKQKHLRLLGRGKTYRFAPVLWLGTDGQPDLSDLTTRENLGACYYAPGTKLVIRVSSVDPATRCFVAAAIKTK